MSQSYECFEFAIGTLWHNFTQIVQVILLVCWVFFLWLKAVALSEVEADVWVYCNNLGLRYGHEDHRLPVGSLKISSHPFPLLWERSSTQSPPAWPWTVAWVQSYARPPHQPEESVQSPLGPTASLAGICLLSIYHRWALAIKGITPQGDCASISTIKLDSGAASSALHRYPVSNGYPSASCCPFLSTVQPGDAHWLTHTERHSLSQTGTLSHLVLI